MPSEFKSTMPATVIAAIVAFGAEVAKGYAIQGGVEDALRMLIAVNGVVLGISYLAVGAWMRSAVEVPDEEQGHNGGDQAVLSFGVAVAMTTVSAVLGIIYGCSYLMFGEYHPMILACAVFMLSFAPVNIPVLAVLEWLAEIKLRQGSGQDGVEASSDDDTGKSSES